MLYLTKQLSRLAVAHWPFEKTLRMDDVKFSLQNHFSDTCVFGWLFFSVLTKLIFNSVSAALYVDSKITCAFIRVDFTVLVLHSLNNVTTCNFN